jgi:hypothetical protein
MKMKLSVFGLLSFLSMVLLLSFSGCYTQLGTTRDGNDEEEYDTVTQNEEPAAIDENNEYTNESCNEDYYRPRVGFSYYYPPAYSPSTLFTIAYSDPWFYDYNWMAYDRWYYTSPYSWYYSSWYSPYYYQPYYYGYYNYNGGSSVYGSKRNDGTMLGNDNARRARDNQYEVGGAARTNFDLPTGAGLNRTTSGVSGANRNTNTTTTSTRRDAATNVGAQRESRTTERSFDQPVRAPRQERQVRTDNRRRDTRSQRKPVETYKPQSPTNNTPPRENRTPSYTPPPAPRNNPPPPSNDGGKRNDNNGGSRSSSSGSGSRDRRP